MPSFWLPRLEKPLLTPYIQSVSSICCLYFQNISQIWSSFHTSADTALAQVPIISYQDHINSLLEGFPSFIRSCHFAHKPSRVKTQVLIIIYKANMVRPLLWTIWPHCLTLPCSLLPQPRWPIAHPLKIFTMFLPQSLYLLFHLSRIFLPSWLKSLLNITFSVRPFLEILCKIYFLLDISYVPFLFHFALRLLSVYSIYSDNEYILYSDKNIVYIFLFIFVVYL